MFFYQFAFVAKVDDTVFDAGSLQAVDVVIDEGFSRYLHQRFGFVIGKVLHSFAAAGSQNKALGKSFGHGRILVLNYLPNRSCRIGFGQDKDEAFVAFARLFGKVKRIGYDLFDINVIFLIKIVAQAEGFVFVRQF